MVTTGEVSLVVSPAAEHDEMLRLSSAEFKCVTEMQKDPETL